jgi:hypothetical protein
MNPRVEELQRQMAQWLYDFAPASQWVLGTAKFYEITGYSRTTAFYKDTSRKKILPQNAEEFLDKYSDFTKSFAELRIKMAQLNANGHAWYTAILTVTPDGKFKYDFDYDHLPVLDIIPSPGKWADEFKKYPRPELQAQVQDWMDGRIRGAKGHFQLEKRLRALSTEEWDFFK